jgi:DNA-binding NarL/FixJ family response regulator
MTLVHEIMPLIRAAIARGAVKPTGSEDAEELTAEALAMAAQGLESAERRGKVVPANSVAFYALQRLKAGRRSGYAGAADVLSAAATVCGRVSVQSMDAGMGPEEDDSGHEMTLHDALAGRGEDVDVAAARHLDWGDVLNRLDDRRQAILTAMVSGYGTNAIADQIQVSPPRVCQLKESLAGYVTGVWGDNGLAECVKESTWRAGLRAAAERRAGRSERAWQP